MPVWLTVKEACAHLKVSRRTLYRLIEVGKLTPHRLTENGFPRFSLEELDAMLRPKEEKP